jgi:ribosomal protein S18 acetylase RimI-like enzyme
MSEDPGSSVIVLYPELQPEAARMLGRAFVDDPLFRAIVPQITDPAARVRALGELFLVMFAVERRSGQPSFALIRGGQVVAAAVTEGVLRPSTLGTAMPGLGQAPRLLRAIGIDGIARALSIFRVLSQSHPPEPHIYLQAIGVEPAWQRRHLGGALLDHLRDQAGARADVTGIYLETATEINVAYYTGKGYEVIGEIHPLGVRMWQMYQRVR